MLKTTESFKREILVYKYKQGGTISLTFANTTNYDFLKVCYCSMCMIWILKKENT